MSASYPTSTKSFTTKVDGPGHTISASHVNDLQDEVVAIENGLRAGLQHTLLFTPDATYDIGASGATRPRDLFLSRNAVVGGTLSLGGNVVSNLLFTDASFDIGASGATRPRDLFLSRLLDLSGTAAGQIKFPAAQNASSDVNTLDDYEEGSWTPVIGGSGGTSGQTYSTQAGRYTKVGRLVTAYCFVALSAKGTITGAVQILGLPFAAETVSGMNSPATVSYFQALATNWVSLGGYIVSAAQAVTLQGIQAAGVSTAGLATADITNTSQFIIGVTYMAGA